ncbi:Domain of unknown function DUF4371 [Cinara cedri]|uniref:Uncharacterized protein n=1 Tax=Cinara cedri TaxID=506608 RepID=A0A5E4N8G2_9HEMI|nr:Domain of unknown function DUF4371 [Cinara cedri]
MKIRMNLTRSFKQEQMSLCIRYVDEDLKVVYERFIEFIDVSSERGSENLTKVIINSIKQNNLHKIPLIVQLYDGAGVMSRSLSGVQNQSPKIILLSGVYTLFNV